MSEKITFKVVYLANGTTPRHIVLKSQDRNGAVEWIDRSGSVYHTPPPPEAKPAILNLNSTETYEVIEMGQKVAKKRVCGYFSYVPESESGKIENVADRTQDTIHRQAHMMLKTHQSCIYRDSTGNDVNPNRWGATTMFELIEESQKILDEVQLNDKINEARQKAEDLYKGSRESFVDFCYAYGLTKVNKTASEVLYNEICQKIIINPDHFLKTYDDKNTETVILLRKALEFEKEPSVSLVSLLNGYYQMNGEILGDSEDKAVYHLNMHPKLKEYIANTIGSPLSFKAEVKELAPVSDHPYISEAKRLQVKALDEQAVKLMKTRINAMFTKANNDISKDPTRRGEILEALKAKLEEKRGDYVTVLPYFDEHVAEQYKYVK